LIREFPPVVEIVARVARRLWPVKTARNLAMRTGKNHRSAEDWLALRTGMSADALAELPPQLDRRASRSMAGAEA